MLFPTHAARPVRCRAAAPPPPATTPILVAALGGNALQKRGAPPSRHAQAEAAAIAAKAVASLAASQAARVVLTHGNGPQVGALARALPDSPLDELDAATEGTLGVVLACALDSALAAARVPPPPSACVVTRVVVDPADPAFRRPTKPVGPVLSKEAADAAAAAGEPLVQEPTGARRVVASPAPRAIVELEALRALVDAGVPTICAGGGGVPVVEGEGRRFEGVAAVIDKDAASALLATALGASTLLLLTDAPCVYDPDRWPDERVPVASPLTAADAAALAARLPEGSMGPKLAAAASFVAASGGRAVAAIGALEDAERLVGGEVGTLVVG